MRKFSLLKYLNKRHALTLVTQFPKQIIEEDIINSLRQQIKTYIIFPSVSRKANWSGFLDKAKQLGVFF
jgi:type IV secretory pathway VirB4 component